MVSRNPFRVRATEYFEEGGNFLSLFGLNALEIFKVDDMWTKIQILRSARGGGKTSILKIFSPKSLNEIYKARTSDEKLSRLYKRLCELDVYDDSGPKVLGVYLSLFANYPVLKQLGFSSQKQMKYCSALISCRIVLATIINIMELKNLELDNDDDLEKIYFKKQIDPNIPSSIPLPCTAKKLYVWASDMETKISNIMENEDTDETMLGGFENLSILHVIRAENIIFEGSSIAEKTLLMLDDVDKLTSEQRTHLSMTILNLRIPLAIWIAERLKALKPEELLSPEATSGREYDTPIILEKFWGANRGKFEKLLADIANRRAAANHEYNIQSFESYIDDHLERFDESFQHAISQESKRLIDKFGSETKYRLWFDRCENFDGTAEDEAKQWRELEILIERDIQNKQKKLFGDQTLSDDDFKITSKESIVAEFYIKRQYNIPYYFGFSKLVKLASSNIHQFLQLSSNLFDEIISSHSIDTSIRISPLRQEKILVKSTERYWNEIKTTIPHSKYVIPFLNSVGEFCFSETNSLTASYGSVTGIALSTNDLYTLQRENTSSNSRYKILSDVISTCLAHNLLEPLPDSKQGQPGTAHLILYLNRLLCFRYKLPLSYGGWRERKLDTLCSYSEKKFSTTRKQTLDFSTQRILEEV